MASQDFIALYKKKYEDQIKFGYENKGILRKLVTTDTDVSGIDKSFPLIGIQTTYERFGSEMIQPTQPSTSKVVMTFHNEQNDSTLSEVDQHKMSNPTYIPTLVGRQTNAIVNAVERAIVKAMADAPTVDSNEIDVNNIDTGYRINGDGSAYSNTGAEQVLSLKGLLKLKEMYDDMGTVPEERYLYLPANAWFGLTTGADGEKITNFDYSDSKVLSESGMVYSNFLGLNLIVGQKMAGGGLPSSGAGTYAFAFSRDTIQLNIQEGGAGAKMKFEEMIQSWLFIAKVRYGCAVVCPSTLIKIACKTAI